MNMKEIMQIIEDSKVILDMLQSKERRIVSYLKLLRYGFNQNC